MELYIYIAHSYCTPIIELPILLSHKSADVHIAYFTWSGMSAKYQKPKKKKKGGGGWEAGAGAMSKEFVYMVWH